MRAKKEEDLVAEVVFAIRSVSSASIGLFPSVGPDANAYQGCPSACSHGYEARGRGDQACAGFHSYCKAGS